MRYCSKYARIYRYSSKILGLFMVMTTLNPAIGSEVDLIEVSQCNQTIHHYEQKLIKLHKELLKLRRVLDVYVEVDFKLLTDYKDIDPENLDGY